MYVLQNGQKMPVLSFDMITENYLPGENKTMIYFGIFIAILLILLAVYFLVKRKK